MVKWWLLVCLLMSAPCEAAPPVYTFAGRMGAHPISRATCQPDTALDFSGGGWMEPWVIYIPLPGQLGARDTFMVGSPLDFSEPDTLWHAFSFVPPRSGRYRCGIDVVSLSAGRLSDYCGIAWSDTVTIILPPQAETWIINRGR